MRSEVAVLKCDEAPTHAGAADVPSARCLTADDELPPTCLPCGYNLTGLGSARCPECGWVIDWRLARLSEEERRAGSPAYKAYGWRVLPAALRSVWLMLFHPVRLARCLRYDDPWRPAMLVAFLAYCAAILPEAIREPRTVFHEYRIRELSGAVSCMAVVVLALGLLSSTRHPILSLARRLRLFTILSLYGTCFVASWGLLGPPLVLEVWNDNHILSPLANFVEDFEKLFSRPDFLARTVLFYWWAAILWVFAFVRLHRWWARLLFLPTPWFAGWFAIFVAERINEACRIWVPIPSGSP